MSRAENGSVDRQLLSDTDQFIFSLLNIVFIVVILKKCQVSKQKMSLELLRRNAASKSNYIRFDDLQRGNYFVRKFSLCDNKYGDEKRIMVHLKNGYVILPERMMNGCNNEKAIQKLNAEKFVMVFKGKDKKPPNRINIDFKYAPGYVGNSGGRNQATGPKRKASTAILRAPKKSVKKNIKPVKRNTSNNKKNKRILPDAIDNDGDDDDDAIGGDGGETDDQDEYEDVEFLDAEAQESDGDEQSGSEEASDEENDDDDDGSDGYGDEEMKEDGGGPSIATAAKKILNKKK